MASYEEERERIKIKLTKLRCPFTWEMSESVKKHVIYANSNIKDEEIDDIESSPLELLMKSLFKCYKAALNVDDNVESWIEKAQEFLMQVQQEKELHGTLRAIEHVFYATKCFLLYKREKFDESAEILENIVDIDDFSKVELGALQGCESVVWSCLNDFGMEKAINTAKKAIEMNEDCALWHFTLAKNLRRQRRSVYLSSDVSDMEENHFLIAYAMSQNFIFGIYYLQMRIEKYYKFIKSREYALMKTANEIEVLQEAKQILMKNPTSYKVLLKLALMFLRANNLDETLLAKKCLDSVEKMVPNDSTYLHYTGMLYEECGEFREALQYYKRAADCNNFVAELAYVRYGWETGEIEPLPHLLRMLKKYDQLIKERQITMLLAIAITYYSLYNDIPNAAEYFLKALTIDPLNKKFKVFYKFLAFNTSNISGFLSSNFLPEAMRCRNRNPTFDQTCQKIKSLLNGENVADLTEEFTGICVDFEEGLYVQLNMDEQDITDDDSLK